MPTLTPKISNADNPDLGNELIPSIVRERCYFHRSKCPHSRPLFGAANPDLTGSITYSTTYLTNFIEDLKTNLIV
ncbi:MAG: hypothetical protein ACRD5E_04825 [Nitrososphaeraceae archaeon]